MPKKNMTPEERAAFGEKMRLAREAKRETKPVQANQDNADIGDLLARMAEMQREMADLRRDKSHDTREQPNVNAQGRMTGTFEKYITDKKHYPDPRERLANELRLQRFAFKDNFELDYGVGLSSYKTIDGINTREPKFTLKLVRIVYDEDSGEPTDQRYVACQLIFHEDPDTALTIAQENNIEVESMGEKQFLDEMRYLRMRDWLLECFYPPPIAKVSDRKEVVIGNQLVEVYTVNSEKSESMAPFFATTPKKF